MTPVIALTWTLPNDNNLDFGPSRDVGFVRNSSDGNYIANLTQKTEGGSDGSFFTSTLLVLEPVDGLNLTCTGVREVHPVKKSVVIYISGMNKSYYRLEQIKHSQLIS